MASFGQVEINGTVYNTRPRYFTYQQSIAAFTTYAPVQLTLTGEAPFLLQALTRATISGAGADVTNTTRFLFKLGNTDGAIWYNTAGNGGTVDRLVDSLMFGNGQFPHILPVPIFYSASASIRFEIQDLSNSAYNLYIGFQGVLLLPSN